MAKEANLLETIFKRIEANFIAAIEERGHNRTWFGIWGDRDSYTKYEVEEMAIIEKAFAEMKYELYDVTSTQILEFKDTIFVMDKKTKKPSKPKEEMIVSTDVEFDNAVDLRFLIVDLSNFAQEHKGNGSKSGSWGYYNDPINLASIFIALRLREVCLHFKKGTDNIEKAQKNLQALRKFADYIIGHFPGESPRPEKFKNLLYTIKVELEEHSSSIGKINQNLDLGTIVEDLNEKGIHIIKNIPLYLTNILMSRTLNGKDFDLKHIFKDQTIKTLIKNSPLGKEIIDLCDLPAFNNIVTGLDFDQKLIESSSSTQDKATSSTSSQNANLIDQNNPLLQHNNLMNSYRDIFKALQELTKELVACQKLKVLIVDGGPGACFVKQKEIIGLITTILTTINSLEHGIKRFHESMDTIIRGEVSSVS